MDNAIRIHTTLNLFLLAIFIVVGTLGISITMAQDHTGAMVGCPLMQGYATMCPMGILEHLQQWRTLFTATNPNTTLLGLMLLISFAMWARRLIKTRQLVYERVIQFALHQFQLPQLKLHNHLVLAFSQGILNPKIY